MVNIDSAQKILEALPQNPDIAHLEQSLRGFAKGLIGRDSVERAVLREEAINILRERGCTSPAGLVDSAMPKPDASEAPNGQGASLSLEDPDPWPDPVSGSELLDEIVESIKRYVALPDHAAEAVAFWVVFAHAHDCFGISPILALQSPEKRCGKTTLLSLLATLIPRPLPTSNITPAALFRTVEAARPSLLIDEMDSFLKKNDELRGILNSGHTHGTAYVVRIVGEDMEPRQFSTWAAKAIALIGRLPATLEDRAIVIPMRRRKPEEPVTPLRLSRLPSNSLSRKAARWVEDRAEALRQADPVVPPEITSDRAKDNWAPLFAIADLAGADWPEKARRVAVALEIGKGEDAESSRTLLLADIRALFGERQVDKLSSDEILNHLVGLEERPWGEFSRGRPLTPQALARLLRPFEVRPKTIRQGDQTPKGYALEDFQDSFNRYLPLALPLGPATPPHSRQTPGFQTNQSATPTPDVADRKAHQPNNHATCGDVAAKRVAASPRVDVMVPLPNEVIL